MSLKKTSAEVNGWNVSECIFSERHSSNVEKGYKMKLQVKFIETEKMLHDEISIVMRSTQNTLENMAVDYMNAKYRFSKRLIAKWTENGVEIINKKTKEVVCIIGV